MEAWQLGSMEMQGIDLWPWLTCMWNLQDLLYNLCVFFLDPYALNIQTPNWEGVKTRKQNT